jgi:hypothetical protein
MSFERKYFFEIADIAAIHFHCGRCHSEHVLPLKQLTSGSWAPFVTSACPHCRTPSGIQPDTTEGRAFLQFIESLGKMAEAANGRNLKLRMEVAGIENSGMMESR